MDSIKILATYGTQDEEKQSKNTTQYILFICMCLTPLYVTIDTGNKTKKNNTICVGQHYAQASTNNSYFSLESGNL
jgi:hypothetical protein